MQNAKSALRYHSVMWFLHKKGPKFHDHWDEGLFLGASHPLPEDHPKPKRGSDLQGYKIFGYFR